MSQRDLERAVARATGESMATVRRLGFLLAEPDGWPDEELDADVIDWDALQSQRFQLTPTAMPLAAAGC